MNASEAAQRQPESYYDLIPYRGGIVPLSAPSHLSLCARWAGVNSPPLTRFRFTELGCGSGSNLLALAHYHPDSTFFGVDSSPTELALARQGAQRLELENVKFVCRDVRELGTEDLAPCDYVVAHGLYSWVPPDARDAILRVCSRILSPDGLTYISYNAQPGWATRRLVRETLLRAPEVQNASIERKGQMAIEVAVRLLADLPSRDYAHASVLAKELERVKDGKPFYVFHEYLAEVNDGFWLGDFVAHARRHGLNYITDAQFCRWEGRVPPELSGSLAARQLGAVEQEETADLLGGRYFRASILGRREPEARHGTRCEMLEQAFFATSLSAQSDPFDLAEGAVERFTGISGAEITLDAGITKAAVVLLARQWPRGMRLHLLFNAASDLLTAHGFTMSNEARVQLSSELATLFQAGQVDLRLNEPVYCSAIPDCPEARALARWEAGRGDLLTTPHHLALALEPRSLKMIEALDGRRSLDELRNSLGENVEQILAALSRWGLLVSSA